MSDVNLTPYLDEKRAYYKSQAAEWSLSNPNPIVGNWDSNNRWEDYDIYLFKDIDTQGKLALDYGCGVGRNIVRYKHLFRQIDGVDISGPVIQKAREYLVSQKLMPLPKLWAGNGKDLQGVEMFTYDVVYSVITLQHLANHTLRQSIMTECYRVLKVDGWFCFQIGYDPESPKPNLIPYGDDHFHDFVDFTLSNVQELEADLNLIGFKNHSFDVRPAGGPDNKDVHDNWLWVRCQK